jgi:hypothetical protein
MTKKEKQEVCLVFDTDGVAYAANCYSEFDNIMDKEFHKRRRNVIKAIKALCDYVGFDDDK